MDSVALPVEGARELHRRYVSCGSFLRYRCPIIGYAAQVDVVHEFERQALAVVPAVDIFGEGLQVLSTLNLEVTARRVVGEIVHVDAAFIRVVYGSADFKLGVEGNICALRQSERIGAVVILGKLVAARAERQSFGRVIESVADGEL